METIEELGEKLIGAIVTHNHPKGSDNEYSFSDADLRLFLEYKLGRLRGIDEKFIYELILMILCCSARQMNLIQGTAKL